MVFIILDLEATCWQTQLPNFRQEIIEIGAYKMDMFGKSNGSFVQFIKPVVHPFLSPYCKTLTNIKQSEIDKAKSFSVVIQKFLDWAEWPDEHCIFFAWGSVDKDLLIADLTLHKLDFNFLKDYVDVKDQYMRLKALSKPLSLLQTLEKEELIWKGQQHRALDDALNLTQLVYKYRDDWKY